MTLTKGKDISLKKSNIKNPKNVSIVHPKNAGKVFLKNIIGSFLNRDKNVYEYDLYPI